MSAIIILVAAGGALWSLRASAIVLAGGRALPDRWNRALGYSKHAVLAAMVGSALASGAARDGFGAAPELVAAAAAVAVAWFSRGAARTMLAGMGVAAVVSAVV